MMKVAPCDGVPHVRNPNDPNDYNCHICQHFVQAWVPEMREPAKLFTEVTQPERREPNLYNSITRK